MNKETVINDIKQNVINNATQEGLSIKILNEKQIELTQKITDKNRPFLNSQKKFECYCTQLLFKR